MSICELDGKARELRELRRMAEELEAEIETIQDAIKNHMEAAQVDTLTGTDWKITYKTVCSGRVDVAALKRELPEIAAMYTKQSAARRFILA